MLSQTISETTEAVTATSPACSVAVIWIDWYAYHVARFRGLQSVPDLANRVQGIELVGGAGVHAGYKFRESLPSDISVRTIRPDGNWHQVGKVGLTVGLWRYLTQLDPEIVLVPGYYTLAGITAALWAKLYRRKSVLMTESTADDHRRIWYREFIKGLLLRMLFDWAVTGGKAHVRYLKQLNFPEGRIAHFYDVVDNQTYRDSALSLRRQSSKNYLHFPYFLYVGRLAPEKNVENLLKSWSSYRESGGTWPLVIVGDGPSSVTVHEAASKSAFASDIHLAGHKGSKDLPTYYASAGCFVLPSTREPWGLVVNEAMASGLPVIVSDRCGCAEDLVVPGLNGFTFDPFDNDQLTRCLTKLESFGETGYVQMGKESSRIINGYTPTHFGSEIARIANSD